MIERGGQKGGIQVPLHGAYAAGAVMPALRELLFDVSSTAVAKLTQLGLLWGNVDQGAARTRN